MGVKETDSRIDELEKRIAELERLVARSDSPVRKLKRTSAKEFLMKMSVKSDTQKVLALSYFLEHEEGMTSFNVSDLEAAFRGAKEKLPANLNDAVNKNIAKGLLMEAEQKKDARKAWYLTSTGEKQIEALSAARS